MLRSIQYADAKKKCVYLPQVCELQKGDFGDETSTVLRHCLKYINIESDSTLMELLHAEKQPIVKFSKFQPQSRKHLELVTLPVSGSPSNPAGEL